MSTPLVVDMNRSSVVDVTNRFTVMNKRCVTTINTPCVKYPTVWLNERSIGSNRQQSDAGDSMAMGVNHDVIHTEIVRRTVRSTHNMTYWWMVIMWSNTYLLQGLDATYSHCEDSNVGPHWRQYTQGPICETRAEGARLDIQLIKLRSVKWQSWGQQRSWGVGPLQPQQIGPRVCGRGVPDSMCLVLVNAIFICSILDRLKWNVNCTRSYLY